jgi:putative transposase
MNHKLFYKFEYIFPGMSHCRKNIRLRGFNYGSNGSYFVTICTIERKLFFGDVLNKDIILNDVGEIAQRYWEEIPFHFTYVSLDKFVIMPNHIHGIITINHKMQFASDNQEDNPVVPHHGVALNDAGESRHEIQKHLNQFSKPISGSLSVILNQYKAAVKRWCNKNDHPDFFWQPRFYDHIINDSNEYLAIRDYIDSNPDNWENDDLHN